MTGNLADMPIRGHQLIEASAGTGKTYTITNLCLRLLLGRNVPWQRPLAISEILILTFTIAATEELKQRIAERILQARNAFRLRDAGEDPYLEELMTSSDDLTRDLKLLAAAGQMMDEASIFTIHGFCARVLGEQAFESGALFDLSMNAERDHILKLASEDVFRRKILTLPAEIRENVMDTWPTPEKLATRLKGFLFRGALNMAPAFTEVDSEPLIRDALAAKKGWQQHQLEALLRSSDLNKGRTPIKRLDQMKQFSSEPGAGLGSELWQIYSRPSLTGALKANGTPPEHPVLDLIESVANRISQQNINLWHELFTDVQTTMVKMKEASNQMTVDDLLTSLAAAMSKDSSGLADTIRTRWPVAMIDEFQDTDDIQSNIFGRAYRSSDHEALLMIGDPKQAIYSFRGADVFTYINAKRQASNVHTLEKNWRSTGQMVDATNFLFQKSGVFGNDRDIPFQPVSAAHRDRDIKHAGVTLTPYEIWSSEGPEGLIAKSNVIPRDKLMAQAAEEVVRLLNDDRTTIDGTRISAGQIAFLVRSRAHALAVEQALKMRGIQSVYLTLESVFLQDTADDVKLILEAILEPTNDRAIRAALGTKLMQCSAQDIDRLTRDIDYQQQILAEFAGYHSLWLDQDIAPMMNKLIEQRQLASKWLGLPEGDRQMTNLRHLIEILQQHSANTPGMYQLLKWFAQEQRRAETVSEEERQLRLESDENLVKIVTMHAAKGLEYDIVMIPMPVFGSFRRDKKDPVLYHQESHEGYESILNLMPDDKALARQKQEEYDEDMRLLYVALTRARFRCYLGVPAFNRLSQSAVASVLGITDLKRDDDLHSRLKTSLPATFFDVLNVDMAPVTPLALSDREHLELTLPPDTPSLDDRWRIHSYTGVSARLTATQELENISGFADDDAIDESSEKTGQLLTRHSFPRGARVGVVLHSLLEHIDFSLSDHTEDCLRACRRLGLAEDWLPVMTGWLNDILNAPLGDTRLSEIHNQDRLDEMEFHFPLKAQPELIEFLTRAGYINPTRLDHLRLEGMMTGLIDLLYRHNGQYFVVDYKSNHLGRSLEHYGRNNVTEAMHHHQYRLQYLIYTVAVHRMLTRKLPGYQYENHFGGVQYLFLRGMKPTSEHGIYFDKPNLEDVITMEGLLTGNE